MINHKWESLSNGTQKRCYVCKCIRTKKYCNKTGSTEITYQNEKSTIIENIGCVVKESLVY